ncbi:hypothetical protein Taro_052635 [Colocasia esculenta]|uniref:Uncharacterized protein n=1 Tax=Colocasia esculenta TaxID=4460 RepID=A0A843XJ75_COLES|nr:hypothetical protein [Colocasia esculenta]
MISLRTGFQKSELLSVSVDRCLFITLLFFPFESPCHYTVYKLVAHSVSGSEVKCTAGFLGDELT